MSDFPTRLLRKRARSLCLLVLTVVLFVAPHARTKEASMTDIEPSRDGSFSRTFKEHHSLAAAEPNKVSRSDLHVRRAVSSSSLSNNGPLCAPSDGNSRDTYDYGLAMDAGSTGTRMHVYRWCKRRFDPRRPVLGPVTVPSLVDSFAVKPGVSAFRSDPGKLCAYLRPLIRFAETTVDAYLGPSRSSTVFGGASSSSFGSTFFFSLFGRSDADAERRRRYASIPIYLKATAGMREIDQIDRDSVMLNIRMCLSDKSVNPFEFAWKYASVISGDEEGSFSFLHVNAVLGNLFSPLPSTVGVIDMGGASVQVVFVPRHDVLDDYFPVSHGAGRRLGLYSHSYESFGHAVAVERMNSAAAAAHRRNDRPRASNGRGRGDAERPIPHPCFPADHRVDVPSSTARVERGEKPRVFRIVGTGDFDRCLDLAETLFESDAACYIPSCTFNGVYQPRLFDTPFVAISGLARAAEELGFTKDIGTVSMREWRSRVESLCAKSHKDLRSISKGHFPPHELCAVTTYAYAFLTRGLGFRENSEQISFRVALDGEEPTVSFGLMLHEIQYMPWSTPKTYREPFLASAAIAGLMTLIAVASRVDLRTIFLGNRGRSPRTE